MYEAGKAILKGAGYYEQIKQYDPGYYIEKYTYKPHKRVAGYLGQKLHEKKKLFSKSSSGYQFYKEYDECHCRYYFGNKYYSHCESS